jgi:hypothetical protein
LLGLTFGTTYYFRIEVEHDDEVTTSSMRTVETGPYQTALPTIEHSGSGHDSYTVVPIIGAETVVTIIDPDGNYVWYHFDDRELDLYRARLSLDGKSIIYNAASVSGDPAESSEIVRVSLDGTEVTHIPVPLLAHDFVEMPDGTIGAIATEYRDFDGETLRGDRIVEISPDGDQTDVWTSWDCFDPAVHRGGDMVDAWAFANALDFDPEENVYYLGMRNFSSIAKIDRESGACEWVLGSTAATISFASGSLPFLHQHQFQVLEESILVLDNDGPFGNVSRVVEYSLDLEAMEATEVWTYTADPEVYTFVLGEPIRLSNGDTMVNWSAAGLMERVTEDGESKWQIGIPMGYAFGFNTIEESLYR